MRTLEDIRPRPGLSVPVVSIVDDAGQLIEADQRALVRHVIQDGRGADVVFAAGTTGEWDRLTNAVRQQVIQVCAEEVRKVNAELSAEGEPGAEAWAGITTPEKNETLENLEFAIACGADAAVLAPLSIQDLDDPVRFLQRDVADLLDAAPRRIPVYLYDNADIAIDPKVPHIRTRQVKEMSRLDFVRGIKVSASRKVLGNYTKAARNFRDRGEFGIYVGNAMLIFEIFRSREGLMGRIAESWSRYRLSGGLPLGVVAGPANVLPREWAHAWQASRAGDVERMDAVQAVVEQFRVGTRAASGRRTIACLKRALVTLGVTTSDAVAPGTPALTRPDAERFDAVFEEVRASAREALQPAFITRAPADGPMSPARPAADLAVVGIGSMVVDRMRRVPRILASDEKGIVSPSPSPAGASVEVKVGGVVLNHLGWAAVLGLDVGIFGKQAEDAEGRFLREAMARFGIATHLVLDGSSTSTAEIFVDPDGGRAIYMAPGATAETTADHIRSHHADFIARGRRMTTEVSQLPLAAAREALAIAADAGAETLVDLDLPPSAAVGTLGSEAELDAVLRAADCLKPSKSAAAELFPEARGDALAIAQAARKRFGNAVVVVTDGAAGCAVSTEGYEGRVPGVSVTPIDTTGAGDAFLGGWLAALDAGASWENAARFANACGAACCEKLGAFPDEPVGARDRVLALHDGDPISLSASGSASLPAPGPPGTEAEDTMRVIVAEMEAMASQADFRAYDAAVALVLGAEEKHRRVHVTGIGKPEHVARYAASLLSSTGTPATFLHGTEASHGSAGQVAPGDVVIAISNSGDTVEMRGGVEAVQALGAELIAVSGNPDSWLARTSQVFLDAGVTREGGGLGLAPRASVAAELLVVASLSAALENARGFTAADYVARHPAGALGRKAREQLDD